MERNLHEIQAVLRSLLPGLRIQYGVDKLWVFGSAARGERKEDSDVDILVEFLHRDFSLLDFIALEQEIEAHLGVKVDLVDRAALREELKPFVLPEAKAV
jgi:predicted nucleotidyltransferase